MNEDEYKDTASTANQPINTDGGAYVEGSVYTSGGDFIGRDMTVPETDEATFSLEDIEQRPYVIKKVTEEGVVFQEVYTVGGHFIGRDLIISNYKVEEIETKDPKPCEPPCVVPYQGLISFEKVDWNRFFGRDELTAQIVKRLHDTSFLTVVGPSGSGKSSVVRAGVVPAILGWKTLVDNVQPLPENWKDIIITPTARPLVKIAETLYPHDETAQDQLQKQMQESEIALADALNKIASSDSHHRLIVIDQFEELFTLCNEDDVREAFIANLLYIAQKQQSHLKIILALRADFYHRYLENKKLAQLMPPENQFNVTQMNAEELTEAILRPAADGGWKLQVSLVNQILDDVGHEPGALPLLSHALLETWNNRGWDKMTYFGYRKAGGVKGAIAHTANKTLESLNEKEQLIAKKLFLRLTDLGQDTLDTRRRVAFSEIRADANTQHVRQKLEQARLIIADEDGLEIAHEALIREWPLLKEWLNADRESLIIYHQLREATQRWQERNEDPSYLYRGSRLTIAEQWIELSNDILNDTDLEHRFLTASLNLRQKELDEREEQQKRELQQVKELAKEQQQRADAEQKRADAEQRRSVLLRRALVIGGILVLFLLAATFIASIQTNKAQENLSVANVRGTEAAEGAATALAAGTAETQALGTSIANSNARATAVIRAEAGESTALAAGTAEAMALATSNAESTRAFLSEGVAQAEKATAEYNAAVAATSEQEAITNAEEANEQRNIVFAQSLAAQSLLTLEQENNTELATLLAIESANANISNNGEVDWLTYSRLYNALEAPFFNNVLLGHEGNVNQVVFHPDGTLLASAAAGADPTVRLWDLQHPSEEPIILREHELGITDIVFSPDGNWLASSSADGSILVWNIYEVINNQTYTAIRLPGDEYVNAITISPDGRWLVSADQGDSIKVWDFQQIINESIEVRKIPTESEILSIAFDPDGLWLASGNRDNIVSLWDFTAFSDEQTISMRPLSGHESYVNAVTFDPSGDWLASGSSDNTVRLWNMENVLNDTAANSIELRDFREHEFINSLSFSPDGVWLAAGAYSYPVDTQARIIRLWNINEAIINENTEPLQLIGHGSSVNSVAFNPNPNYLQLASGSNDKTVRLWSIERSISNIKVLLEQDDPVVSLTFASNGKWLAAGVGDGGFGTTYLWDINNIINTIQVESIELTGQDWTASSVAFSPNNAWLVNGLANGDFRLSNISETVALPSKQPTEVTVQIEWYNRINSLLFSDDNNWLITGNEAGNVLVWDTDDLYNSQGFFQAPFDILLDVPSAINSVAKSPYETWLASGGEDGLIHIWEMDKVIENLSTSPIVIEGHDGAIFSVAFSADEDWLVSSGQDGTIRLWDANKLISNSVPKRIIETVTEIRTLAITSTGKWLAGGGADGNLYLWDFGDLVDGETADPIVLAGGEVVAFSPDGLWLVSGGSDGKVHLWPTPDNLIDLGCERAIRNLTWAEWQQFFSGESYRKVCPNLPTHFSVPDEFNPDT